MISVVTNLAHQSPLLLVYFVGLILAVIFWQRCPGPCALTLAGTGLLLLVAVVHTVLIQILLHMRAEHWIFTGVGLVSSLLSAVGMALCLAAVFVGRGGDAGGWADQTAAGRAGSDAFLDTRRP